MSDNPEFSLWLANEAQAEAFIEGTSLIPALVLDRVVEEIVSFFNNHPQTPALYATLRGSNIEAYIAGRSALLWQNNERFRALMEEEDPRGTYYAFVRHWVAGVLKERFPVMYAKLPSDFSTGAPLPRHFEEAMLSG